MTTSQQCINMPLSKTSQLDDISITHVNGSLKISNPSLLMELKIGPSCLEIQNLIHRDHVNTTWIEDGNLPLWSLPELSAFGKPQNPQVNIQTIQQHRWLHDQMVVTVTYDVPQLAMHLRYAFNAYPGICGIRMQMMFKFDHQPDQDQMPSWLGSSMSLQLPFKTNQTPRTAVGFYNDTQHRNSINTPIRRSMRTSDPIEDLEIWDWNNILSFEKNGAGLTLVKESHKAVNQNGIDGGAFVVEKNQVRISGLGLCNQHYQGQAWFALSGWRKTWANWIILYSGGESQRQLTLKQFDRARFPFIPQRDAIVMSNTWGSRGSGDLSRNAAEQDNVMREIDSAADLGIDLVQIDDGWQCEPHATSPTNPERDWNPHPSRWPDGWKTLVSYAQSKNIKLGLWFNSHVDVQKMLANQRTGGFVRFKLDFADCKTREELESLLHKARTLIEANGSMTAINWDLTENNPRVGYFLGREFGSLYLANRENGPAPLHRLNHIRYTPSLVLRDAWHLAHEMNLNQFQISYQNLDEVMQDLSNCQQYSHDYALAITLMGLPILFTETQRLTEQARLQIRPLLARYKQYRNALTRGYVFPLGNKPSDKTWTGFQCHHPDSDSGHVILFRERHNDAPTTKLQLHFADHRQVVLKPIWTSRDMVAHGDQSNIMATSQTPAVAGWFTYRLL